VKRLLRGQGSVTRGTLRDVGLRRHRRASARFGGEWA
jgi:hypothetical protein